MAAAVAAVPDAGDAADDVTDVAVALAVGSEAASAAVVAGVPAEASGRYPGSLEEGAEAGLFVEKPAGEALAAGEAGRT